MKMKLFLLTAGTVILLAACNSDASVQPNDKNTGGELSVVATKAATYAGSGDEAIVFNGSDIKSFNLTTGELIFSDLTFEQLRSRTEDYTLTFYLGDRELFKSTSVGYDTLFILSGRVINDLVFILRGDLDERLYLMDGFPALDWVKNFGVSETEAAEEREANTQKRKAEWDLFIEYLEDAGKVTEHSGNPGNSIPGDYPAEIEIGDYVPEGCGWKTKNVTADSLYVIRSIEEFRTFVSCPETDVPAIDFDRYSLLFVHGWATNGINDITKNLQQTSATGYVLNVEIFLNATKIAPRWNIAVLTPKLPQNAAVRLNRNIQ
jgi:hypothetical protein